MGYARLAGRLYGAPLLMTPERAAEIEGVFRRYADGDVVLDGWKPGTRKEWEQAYFDGLNDLTALATVGQVRRTDGGYALTGDGIAILPLVGSFVHRGTAFDALSGLTSYGAIGAMLDAALEDYRVHGIVLDVDSPGGEGAGVIELAERINAASKRKPVYAVANEHAFSAAYWLASAAERLVVPRSGMVGSVGVVMMHVDQSRMNEKRGIEVTHIHAGARKVDFSPHAPLSDRARGTAQAAVDRLYEQFVDAVATHRDIDAQVVRDTEAGLLNADEALELGMADDVGTLSDAVEMLRSDRRGGSAYGRRSKAPIERIDMTTKETATPSATTINATAEQLANERAAGFGDGNSAGRAEGGKAERARVQAITTCDEAKERPLLAQHLAFETDMPAEAAQALLAKAAKETSSAPANPLDAVMRGTNPKVGVDIDKPAAGENVVRIDTRQIYDRLGKQLADAHAAHGKPSRG